MTPVADAVDVQEESWDSDESSFYGDDDEKSTWKDRLDGSNAKELWNVHERLRQSTPFKARIAVAESSEHATNPLASVKGENGAEIEAGDHGSEPASGPLHNRMEGRRNAKQLNESVAVFIKRAPPLNSVWSEDGWLWVENPRAKPRTESPDLDVFVPLGTQYLNDYLDHRHQLETKNPGKAASAITRMLKPARDKLKTDIEQLAATSHVLSGKWLLFPRVEDVPTTWRTVVEAVVEGRLGNTAKIATDTDKKEDDGIRVICVYTADFTDESEVRRVCRSLNDLGLIPTERSIWYKADAYTYLNINRDNKYNIPPTSYSSKDILTTGNPSKGTKRPAASAQAGAPRSKKPAAVDWSF